MTDQTKRAEDWESRFLSIVQELTQTLEVRGYWTGDKTSRDGARLIHAFALALDTEKDRVAAALEQAHREGKGDAMQMAEWITREARLQPRIDHACAECIPDGPMVQTGFRCAVHIAQYLLSKSEEVKK